MWQKNAWADREFCNKFAATEVKHIQQEHCNSGRRGLWYLDNLDGQSTPEFRQLCKDAGADLHFLPPGTTDTVQVIDAGIGRWLKLEMENVLDEWLEDSDNFTKWKAAKFSAAETRILLLFMVGEAWERISGKLDARAIFDKLGGSMIKSSANDDAIKLEGLPDYKFQTQPIDSPAEPVAEVELGPEHEPEEMCGHASDAMSGDEPNSDIDDSESDVEGDDEQWVNSLITVGNDSYLDQNN